MRITGIFITALVVSLLSACASNGPDRPKNRSGNQATICPVNPAEHQWLELDRSDYKQERMLARRHDQNLPAAVLRFMSAREGSSIWATDCPVILKERYEAQEAACEKQDVFYLNDLVNIRETEGRYRMTVTRGSDTPFDVALFVKRDRNDPSEIVWLESDVTADGFRFFVYLRAEPASPQKIRKGFWIEAFNTENTACTEYQPEHHLCEVNDMRSDCRDNESEFKIIGPRQTHTGGGHEPDPDKPLQ